MAVLTSDEMRADGLNPLPDDNAQAIALCQACDDYKIDEVKNQILSGAPIDFQAGEPVIGEVLGGGEVSGDYVAESGAPFTVTMDDASNNGSLGPSDGNGEAAWYPNLASSGNPNSGGHSTKQWFNQLAYVSPAANTFGTNPRNSLIGPDYVGFDFSLAKSFSIPGWKRGKVQIRMDTTNIFNHPAFNDPDSVLSHTALQSGTPSVSVGAITGVNGADNGSYGRVIQLSGRFSF